MTTPLDITTCACHTTGKYGNEAIETKVQYRSEVQYRSDRSEAQMFCVPFNYLTVLTDLAVLMESSARIFVWKDFTRACIDVILKQFSNSMLQMSVIAQYPTNVQIMCFRKMPLTAEQC